MTVHRKINWKGTFQTIKHLGNGTGDEGGEEKLLIVHILIFSELFGMKLLFLQILKRKNGKLFL